MGFLRVHTLPRGCTRRKGMHPRLVLAARACILKSMTQDRETAGTVRSTRHRAWLLAAVPVIMLAMFVVPYTLLRGVDAWYGSALFWTLATAAVIALNVVLSSDWED